MAASINWHLPTGTSEKWQLLPTENCLHKQHWEWQLLINYVYKQQWEVPAPINWQMT